LSRTSWIPRRLRERNWFWPKAAWIGFGWFGRIVDHPLSSFLAWVLALATIFLGGIALHVSLLILGFVVLVIFCFVVARGARLKWEQDSAAGAGSDTPSPAAPHIGTYHAHGPTLLLASPDLLKQLDRVDAQPTSLTPEPTRPKPGERLQADTPSADARLNDPGLGASSEQDDATRSSRLQA
jgi:hypothetical protein